MKQRLADWSKSMRQRVKPLGGSTKQKLKIWQNLWTKWQKPVLWTERLIQVNGWSEIYSFGIFGSIAYTTAQKQAENRYHRKQQHISPQMRINRFTTGISKCARQTKSCALLHRTVSTRCKFASWNHIRRRKQRNFIQWLVWYWHLSAGPFVPPYTKCRITWLELRASQRQLIHSQLQIPLPSLLWSRCMTTSCPENPFPSTRNRLILGLGELTTVECVDWWQSARTHLAWCWSLLSILYCCAVRKPLLSRVSVERRRYQNSLRTEHLWQTLLHL